VCCVAGQVEIDKPLGLKLKESSAKGGGLVVEVSRDLSGQ
jgi:hypothetical protein